MLDDGVAAGHLWAQHLVQFILCLGSMGTQGVDEGDVVWRNPGLGQRRQEHRQHPVVGHGARQVAEHHRHRVPGPDQIYKRWGAQW